MTASPLNTDICLQPGEYYFGRAGTRIRTLLGSCISLSFWHPHLKIGGLCHYMLPSRRRSSGQALDGRYADEALALLLLKIRASETAPESYEVKIFGGGDMLGESLASMDDTRVARINIEAARRLVAAHALRVRAEHVGGVGYRQIIFDISSGDVWVRHHERVLAAGTHRTEGSTLCHTD